MIIILPSWLSSRLFVLLLVPTTPLIQATKKSKSKEECGTSVPVTLTA